MIFGYATGNPCAAGVRLAAGDRLAHRPTWVAKRQSIPCGVVVVRRRQAGQENLISLSGIGRQELIEWIRAGRCGHLHPAPGLGRQTE